ncbi:MAG: hypothetical protein M3Z97_12610 [Candidatus Dormibacteraeota bacterium]|nr:hypothetical protein [Candidatus Dormibacteraeota bacterium]
MPERLTQPAAEGPDLELERSGGFAGLTLRTVVPLSQLTAAQLKALRQTLARPIPRRRQPDRFEYRLRSGGREVVLSEQDLPPALRPLLSRLEGPV